MKQYGYNLIVLGPSFIFLLLFDLAICIFYVKSGKLNLIGRWIAKNIFPDIMKEKKKEDGTPRWLFKDIDLTSKERILKRVWQTFFALFGGILLGTMTVFLELLLLEVSSDCDVNDPSKDCFEVKFSGLGGPKIQDPINCSSAAIQNGTTYVFCYRIVFNLGVATGASYGVFKLSVLVFSLTSRVLLMIKKPETVKALRFIIMSLCIVASLILVGLGLTPFGFGFFLENLIDILQTIVILTNSSIALGGIPWDELTELNGKQNNPNNTGLENPVAATDDN